MLRFREGVLAVRLFWWRIQTKIRVVVICTSQHIVDFFSRSLLPLYPLSRTCICCGVGIFKLEVICFLPQKYDIQYMRVFTPGIRNELGKLLSPKLNELNVGNSHSILPWLPKWNRYSMDRSEKASEVR